MMTHNNVLIFEHKYRYPIHERVALEAEIIRRCLSRTEYQCSFLEYRGLKIIYRRYASLFFVVAVDGDEEVWQLYGFPILIR